MLDALVPVMAAAFGLLIGSFLNVCIYRWPRDLSVVRPRSRCTECERQIAWYDNIPLFSYALLRGRCRYCGARISWRYPAVEFLTAGLFGYVAWRYGLTIEALRYAVLCAMLVTLAFADAETRTLPDQFTLGGLAAGLLFALLTPVPDSVFHSFAGIGGWRPGWRVASLGESLLGAAIPAGTLWLSGWLFYKIRKKEGLGLGDVKLMAMMGAFLGLSGTLLTLVTGSLAGSVIGLVYITAAKEDAGSYELPFGTFLAFAGIAVALAGRPVIDWYVRLL